MTKRKRVVVVYECLMTDAELTAYIAAHGDKPYQAVEIRGLLWTEQQHYVIKREGDFN